jgi:putative transcriptional regulator
MAPIKHHLSDSLLMAYSAGTLPEAFNLVIATHVSMCDECRARMESFDTVGGAVLESCDLVSLDAGSLEATLAMIAGAPVDRVRPATPCKGGIFPAPLRDYVGGDLESVRWKKLGGGVSQYLLDTSRDATVRLLHIPAGTAVPDHGHRGTELTLVLKGAFIDGNDRFARGDVEIADEDLQHTPIADVGEDCICLAATDARLKFRKLIPRMAQPFIGM